MSECSHTQIDWNLEQAEENPTDEFVIPGVCTNCGEAVSCRATIDEIMIEEEML